MWNLYIDLGLGENNNKLMPNSPSLSTGNRFNQSGSLASRRSSGPRKALGEAGVINPILIIFIVIICLAGLWFFISAKKTDNSQPADLNTPKENKNMVDKKDKDWMNKYCAEEVVKLPEAPFEFKSKEGPIRSGAMVWISKMFPKDTRFDHQSGCRMDYKFDESKAYASLGVEHKNDIKYVIEFEKRVDEMITSKIDSSWRKISPLAKEQSGNPAYTYQGFPMVFTRENPDLGIVEYINIFFGAGTLYIKIEFYAK